MMLKRLTFGKKKSKTFKEAIDALDPEGLKEWYSLVPDPANADAPYWCVAILKGDFMGLIYKYGAIGIRPEAADDGTLPVKFEYDVVNVPISLRQMEMPDEKKFELEYLIGTIMMSLVQEDLDNKKTGDMTGRFEIKRNIV